MAAKSCCGFCGPFVSQHVKEEEGGKDKPTKKKEHTMLSAEHVQICIKCRE